MDDKERLRLAKEALDSGSYDKETIEYIFPELKEESEDERIRNIIKESLRVYFEGNLAIGTNDIDYAECLAWLEKQGEQKTEIRVVVPKFRIGDVVKSKSQPMLPPREIMSIDKDCYWCTDRGCIGFAWEDNFELYKQKPVEWSEEDEEMLKIVIKSCEQCGNEYAYYWLKSLKDRVQPQQEKERILGKLEEWLDEYISNLADVGTDTLIGSFRKYLDGKLPVKSLSQWKPSDEQMKALKEACDEHWEPDGLDPLYMLWEQLKKLREE